MKKNTPPAILFFVLKRWIFPLIFFPLAIHLMHLFFFHFDEKFHSKDFAHHFHPSYATSIAHNEHIDLDALFSQPFVYLGHGKQMVAFESLDKKYVLKLFNPQRPLKKGWYKHWKYWKRYSSLKWIFRENLQKNARLKKLFIRHRIAYECIPKETGLVFLHLSPSKQISHYVTVIDNRGKSHILALSETPFVLQKKAILVQQHLRNLLQENNLAGAKQAVLAIENLLKKRVDSAITDRIQTMENNYGFVDSYPIQIDVGRIKIDPSLKISPEAEQKRVLSNFKNWVQSAFPELQ